MAARATIRIARRCKGAKSRKRSPENSVQQITRSYLHNLSEFLRRQDRDPRSCGERAKKTPAKESSALRVIISLFSFALPCHEIIHVMDRNKPGSNV